MTRYVTTDPTAAWIGDGVIPYSNPLDDGMEDPERYRIYRLCTCWVCNGTGKTEGRCKSCRGEGKSLDLVATCTDPASVGVALVTLATEGEFDECPIGLMDRPEGQSGKWLIKPWGPSARNVSDAGRTLRSARTP